MYVVRKITNDYGHLIVIEENGDDIVSPLPIFDQAIRQQKEWQQQVNQPVRFFLNDQIMTNQQMEQWANEEYQSLPKCQRCVQILDGEMYPGGFCGNDLFCSSHCYHQNYMEKMVKMNEEMEEVDYL